MKLIKTIYTVETFEEVEHALENGWDVHEISTEDSWLELDCGYVVHIIKEGNEYSTRKLWQYHYNDYSLTNIDFIKNFVIVIPVQIISKIK